MPAATVPGPIGWLGLEADGDRLVRIRFHVDPPAGQEPELDGLLAEAAAQLAAYFARRLRRFDLPIDLRGTPFQREVWQALTTIPYGSTWTYRQLAEGIGRPAAVRAVGAANGRNPIPIVIPCHRVIGMNGRLVGFGGGLETKRALLDLEQGIQEIPGA